MAERRRRLFAAAAVASAAFALLASAPRAAADTTPTPSTSGTAALQPIDRYRAALAGLPPLGDMVFQYTESRTGPTRTIVELHRVYRRVDGVERNETIAVNGETVVPAIVRFSTRVDWPYDVRAFVVGPDDYTVMPTGPKIVAGKRAYGLSAVRTTTGDFAITGLYLDEKTWLPLRETYAVVGGGCTGAGSIEFARIGRQWLPTAAQVSCTVGGGGAMFKETIAFAGYAFPPTLPADIFGGAT